MKDGIGRCGVRLKDVGDRVGRLVTGQAQAASKQYPGQDDQHAGRSRYNRSPLWRESFGHGELWMLSKYQVATIFLPRLGRASCRGISRANQIGLRPCTYLLYVEKLVSEIAGRRLGSKPG